MYIRSGPAHAGGGGGGGDLKYICIKSYSNMLAEIHVGKKVLNNRHKHLVCLDIAKECLKLIVFSSFLKNIQTQKPHIF